jgi:hypothetical protein
MYYSYVEIEYVATSFSPARTDLAVKLLSVSWGKQEANGKWRCRHTKGGRATGG